MNSQEEQKARVLAMFTSEVADLFKDKDLSVESFLIMGKTVHVIYIADDKKAKEDLKETIIKQSFGTAYMPTTVEEMESPHSGYHHDFKELDFTSKNYHVEFEGTTSDIKELKRRIFLDILHIKIQNGKIPLGEGLLYMTQDLSEDRMQELITTWENRDKPKDWSNATLEEVPVDWLPQIGQKYWNFYKPSMTVNGPFIGHPQRDFDQNDWRHFPTKELAQMYQNSIREKAE